MDTVVQDLRYACRQLGRAPGFTAVAVLTLALGIGACTAIFSAVDAVLLEPLPYGDADRIVTLWRHDQKADVERDDVAPADFLDWRERSTSFEALAAADPYTKDYMGPDGPERLRTWRVTEGFFGAFDTDALLGRTLGPADHEPGAPAVVVLSHRLWQGRFGGDPSVVGRTLRLEDEPTTVVGVMPPGFGYPPDRDLWIPRPFEGWEAANRTSTFWLVVGKLRSGVGIETARAELDTIAAELAREYPATNTDIGITVVPLAEHLVGGIRPALLLFFAAVAAVLLIACVNVANLLLARAANRCRELAMRAVLGASRARVLRQLVTESIVLSGLGGLLGLALAAFGLSVFESLRPEFPNTEALALNGRAVAFTCVLALGTALVFGLVPALDAAASDLRARLGGGAASAAPRARRLRGGLVVAELALATVLLISAGLLVRSFATLIDVERGYRSENVLAVTVQAWRYYPGLAERGLFVRETLERIGALPGVVAAGVTSSLPLAEDIGADIATYSIPGQPPPPGAGEPTVHTAIVTGGYFEALGIPLRAGRVFGSADGADAPRVVLVNEAMARREWPSEDPIGETIMFEFDGGYQTTTTAEVVGVVGNVRHAGLDEAPRPSLFLPHAQHPTGAFHFTLRSVGDPTALVQAVQEEIWALNAAMPVDGVTTLEGLLDDSLRERRFTLLVLLTFSVTALALATIGTYGLLSYESSRRAREIGVRIALGADRGRVLGLVVGQGLRLSLVGIGIGVVLALGVTRLIAGFLFGVARLDPATFVTTAVLLVAVTVIASYVPARRAARLDPMLALRAE